MVIIKMKKIKKIGKKGTTERKESEGTDERTGLTHIHSWVSVSSRSSYSSPPILLCSMGKKVNNYLLSGFFSSFQPSGHPVSFLTHRVSFPPRTSDVLDVSTRTCRSFVTSLGPSFTIPRVQKNLPMYTPSPV